MITFETKSEKSQSIMKKFFIAIMLNTMVLPMLMFRDMQTFVDKANDEGLLKLQYNFNENVLERSSFFLNVLIIATFISGSL